MDDQPDKPPQMFVCPKCGGQDLSVSSDAYWDVEKQKFALDNLTGGEDYCEDCHDYVAGEFRAADLKTLAKLAICNSNNQGDTNDQCNPPDTGSDPRQLDFGF